MLKIKKDIPRFTGRAAWKGAKNSLVRAFVDSMVSRVFFSGLASFGSKGAGGRLDALQRIWFCGRRLHYIHLLNIAFEYTVLIRLVSLEICRRRR